MQLVENVLGNSNDPAWKARLADATIDTLELSQWDAQKNRLRKDTRNGQAIAVSLDRNAFLHDGDILLWDEKTKQAVICKIDLCEVLIIDLSGLQKLPADQLIERCVQLGHALGNQHWPAIVQNGFVYVPMAVNRLVMNSVMNTHHFKDITFRFAPGSEIVDLLEPTQARRLFGGTERPMDGGHTHAPAGEPESANDMEDGYCGNTSATVTLDGSVYTLPGSDAITLTAILEHLDYTSDDICSCSTEFTVETEIGTEYEVNLTEYFVRCDAGQAALTQKQADAIREIVERLGE